MQITLKGEKKRKCAKRPMNYAFGTEQELEAVASCHVPDALPAPAERWRRDKSSTQWIEKRKRKKKIWACKKQQWYQHHVRSVSW